MVYSIVVLMTLPQQLSYMAFHVWYDFVIIIKNRAKLPTILYQLLSDQTTGQNFCLNSAD